MQVVKLGQSNDLCLIHLYLEKSSDSTVALLTLMFHKCSCATHVKAANTSKALKQAENIICKLGLSCAKLTELSLYSRGINGYLINCSHPRGQEFSWFNSWGRKIT